ncbi:proline-rich receptor-like protein kinase PERK10 [Vitis riparia]|uniref:proline-rich receptor-like protein kinase PERK10 n=1 Tax=Vitis riparia TaxID=96939 RepID=UPI00155AC35F|nr:proline-rich receptor-like protein kinase PERK10 [Vitis riparia]
MARTRGAKSSSPSGRKRATRETPVQGSTSEPPRPLVVPPPVEDAPLSPPMRRYQTRSSSHPPKKKARVSDSEPINLTEPSPDPSPEPSSEPPSKPQPSQSPPTESQILSGMTPERYHMEHLLTPKDFFYPRVAMDFYQSMTMHQVRDRTVIHFTIDGRHEHLGFPYEPQLERKCICREIFTLDKWTNMTAYSAEPRAPAGAEHPEIPHPEQPEEPQQVEIPADMGASTEPIHEVAPSTIPATPRTPLVIPATSEPSPSSEPRIAISIFEYRGAYFSHSDSAYYHLEADSAPSGYSISS